MMLLPKISVVADTCTAMDQWVHDPAAESALSQLLPCLDAKTIGDTLDITKTMTSTAVDMTNAYTVNISNFDHFPHNNPFYHNQSGPLVPLLCNPLDEHHNPRPCAPNEILLANASQVRMIFICYVLLQRTYIKKNYILSRVSLSYNFKTDLFNYK